MFTTILVASDGSDDADRLVAVARRLARDGHSKVVVAHVTKLIAARGGHYPVCANEDLLQLEVRHQVADLKAAGLDVELKLRSTFGETALALAEVAKDCCADLIVTRGGRHGRFAGSPSPVSATHAPPRPLPGAHPSAAKLSRSARPQPS
jgi:nucleotide-binding universal stress UspA family protein